jgi:hypothetical protein
MKSGSAPQKNSLYLFFLIKAYEPGIQFSMPTLILIHRNYMNKNNMTKSTGEKFREFSEGKWFIKVVILFWAKKTYFETN